MGLATMAQVFLVALRQALASACIHLPGCVFCALTGWLVGISKVRVSLDVVDSVLAALRLLWLWSGVNELFRLPLVDLGV